MSEVVTDYRLAEARSHRESHEEDARGSAEEHARIRRHLDAVRAAEASAAEAARGRVTGSRTRSRTSERGL